MFGTEIEIIVEWPNLQMLWKVQVPPAGFHETGLSTGYGVIEKTGTFATIDHGVIDGDQINIDDVEIDDMK